MNDLFQKLRRLYHIPKVGGEQDVYDAIKKGVYFKGYNLWLLIFAMVIACVGLNNNNTAAIIGAMLLSPLMGPIVGLGFGFGIGSKNMIQASVLNWLIMVGTSLLASSVFFMLSPFDFATDELNNYRSGSIFDVIIAFFGGLAGFIGTTRKETVKVIAGVAVATSCMAPLCTAGYGIATLQLSYFLGGLYVFCIYCFFIGLATWLLTIILGHRDAYKREYEIEGKGKVWLIITSLVLIVPSIWFAVKKWERESLQHTGNQYIASLRNKYPELVIVQNETVQTKGKDQLIISVLNDSASMNPEIFNTSALMSTDLNIVWHFAPSQARSEIEYLQVQIKNLESKMKSQDSLIQNLNSLVLPHPLDSVTINNSNNKNIN
jgi:uncharacterized hydrophobic protein (TIGR00271 family)